MLHFISAFLLFAITRSTGDVDFCALIAQTVSDDSPLVNAQRVDLTDAMNDNGAVCLDGSVPVFYWRQGTGDGVNKFHVFFEGGGWCSGIDEQVSLCQDTCLARANIHAPNSFGSSIGYPESAMYDCGYMSTLPSINPLSHNWNTVYVKYCDGASFSGNNDTTETVGNMTLHWRGHRILNGVFDLLQSDYGFLDATDVLMSGCSAGGLTTWLHAQYVYDTYVEPLNANFLAMPGDGWFPEYENAYGLYVTSMKWTYSYSNASLNSECINANTNEPWKCMFAENNAPFENVKMFALQAQYDWWQNVCMLVNVYPFEWPYTPFDAAALTAYGANLATNFENLYINGGDYDDLHGGFVDSCLHHCGSWNQFEIDGMTASQAQFDFYYDINTHDKFWFKDEEYPCVGCCKITSAPTTEPTYEPTREPSSESSESSSSSSSSDSD